MAEEPEYFSFPVYETGEHDYFSKEEQEVRKKPWDIFLLLLALMTNGVMKENAVIISVPDLQRSCKIKNIPVYIKILEDYGFTFQGLKNGKLPKMEETISLEYPDNNAVLVLLYLVANKVTSVQLSEEKNLTSTDVIYRNGFISWNYRIVGEDLASYSKPEECDYVADKLHTEEERETIKTLHRELMKEGYKPKLAGRNEGPCIRYYSGSAGIYTFAANEIEGKLQLELRMKKMDKCLTYLPECSERIRAMFCKSDPGCQNRQNGTCHSSIRFILDGEERWHCGCCGGPFQIFPVKDEIPVYLRLVQLGK